MLWSKPHEESVMSDSSLAETKDYRRMVRESSLSSKVPKNI